MSIYTILQEYGEFGSVREFNGSLSDYVNEYDDVFNETFRKLLEINTDIRVYRNFPLKINHQMISNKKIDYRDIAKIPDSFAKVPYVLYWKNENSERGVIINTDSYEEARGMYYCLTEPQSAFEDARCDVFAMNLCETSADELIDSVEKLCKSTATAGFIQKRFDSLAFVDEEQMRDHCVKIAKTMFEQVCDQAPSLNKEEKTGLIYSAVLRAFLLKKSLYVKYMTNKKLLTERHSGNPMEQRKFAKAYVDEITIIPYYNLWNL